MLRFLKGFGIFVLVFFLASVVFVGWQYRLLLVRPMFSEGSPRIVVLKPGMSASGFITTLYEAHLISKKQPVLRFLQYHRLSSRLKTGFYEIKPGETVVQLIYRVVAGDVLVQYFRVIEGTTVQKIKHDLENAAYLVRGDNDWAIVKGAFGSAEGLLLPETYQYDAGSQAVFLLDKMHAALLHFLNNVWQSRETGLPYETPYDLLKAASIIEKETDVESERAMISRVIVNRLQKGMRLQMDPTVIYALGNAYTGKLSHDDMKVDSPYNTYRYKGLPPTPICMPGKASIVAAAHPSTGDVLYFVAKGDGTHLFSNTWQAHQKAVQAYRKLGGAGEHHPTTFGVSNE